MNIARVAHPLRRYPVWVLAIVAVLEPCDAVAQVAREMRLVEGRVTRASDKGPPAPVVAQWVVLHRVGSDYSAPLDSARTDRNGRYRIRYARPGGGDPEALYFVSARYGGIAYFSPPLRVANVKGGDADVLVYETTTDTTALRVQGRHLVLSAPRGQHREVAEIFEIDNAGWRTVVARDSTTPLWSTLLPAGAESASVAPGDLSIASVVFRGGRAEVYSPISPGVRQLVLTYSLPANAFPLSVPIGRAVSVLEVLLEEPRAVVQGGPLGEVAPAAIDGRMFRRFLAQDVPASAVMRLNAPAPVEQNRRAMVVLATVTAITMVGALVIWFSARRRRPLPTANGRRPTGRADVLIAELATLDVRFEKESASEEQRAAYAQQRAQLKDRIARALAEETWPA